MNEGVMEENNLSINIFHNDEEVLHSAIDFLIPVEIGDYGQVNSEKCACDGL